MKYNINIDLFRRFKPETKLKMIKEFTESELQRITFNTIQRMVKEAGTRITPNKVFKFLKVGIGNNGNSIIDDIYEHNRNTIYMNVYIQGYDTDRYSILDLRDFLANIKSRTSLGEFKEEYLSGDCSLINAYYDTEDKARVIRMICDSYVRNKYKINE